MLDLIAEKWIVDSGVELEEGFRLWVSGRGGRGGGEGVRGGEGRGGEMRGGRVVWMVLYSVEGWVLR